MFLKFILISFLPIFGTCYGSGDNRDLQQWLSHRESEKAKATEAYLAQFPTPLSKALVDPEGATVQEIHGVLKDFLQGLQNKSPTLELFHFYHRFFRVLRTSKSSPHNWKQDTLFRVAQAYFFHELYEERYTLVEAFQELLLSKSFEYFHGIYVSKRLSLDVKDALKIMPLQFEFVLAAIPPVIAENLDDDCENLGSYARKVSSVHWHLATAEPHFASMQNGQAQRFENDLNAQGPRIDLSQYLLEKDNLNVRFKDLSDEDWIDEIESEYGYFLGRVEYVANVLSSAVESCTHAHQQNCPEARLSIDMPTFLALDKIQYYQSLLLEREPFSQSLWQQLQKLQEKPPARGND